MAILLSPQAERTLIENRTQTNGSAGTAWVHDLPQLVTSLAESWSLNVESHFANLSYNYVARVVRADGSPAVLKVCYPDNDFAHEEQALRVFDGEGCARLLQSDTRRCALLIEALEPGLTVSSLHDDATEVSATAAVMRRLHRPLPGGTELPTFTGRIEELARSVAEHGWAYEWLDRGIALGRDLVASPGGPAVVLHGDLHHDNVLSSGAEWRCIDPHGVIGESAWEVGAYLYNNLPTADGEQSWRRTIRRRADQFAGELRLDAQRLYACAAVYAVISSVWSLEDGHDLQRIVKRRAVMTELAGF